MLKISAAPHITRSVSIGLFWKLYSFSYYISVYYPFRWVFVCVVSRSSFWLRMFYSSMTCWEDLHCLALVLLSRFPTVHVWAIWGFLLLFHWPHTLSVSLLYTVWFLQFLKLFGVLEIRQYSPVMSIISAFIFDFYTSLTVIILYYKQLTNFI